MKPRRRFLSVAAAVALTAISGTAWGQAYPTHPARIVVGFPAGGPQDITARIIAQWLTDRLGQQFLVESKPGAGGTIGAEFVVNSPPDGYTLLAVRTAEHDRRPRSTTSSSGISCATLCQLPTSAGCRWWPRSSRASGQVDPGVDRLRQGQSQQDQLRICRRRHAAARRRRTVQDDDRRRRCSTCPIGARPRRSPICSAAKCSL